AIASEGQKANLTTDYVLRIFGLEVCADTVVGNAMLRGILVDKENVLQQTLVGPAKALSMDEISTGLDSSTTFQIVNSLNEYVHILKGTTAISLLQPAPKTYNLFYDITLLSDSFASLSYLFIRIPCGGDGTVEQIQWLGVCTDWWLHNMEIYNKALNPVTRQQQWKHDFLGVVAAVNVAFPVVFALVFAISVKMLNFQRR
ncbi:ABC transporter G family member 36, partial [Mucuna pruriens]